MTCVSFLFVCLLVASQFHATAIISYTSNACAFLFWLHSWTLQSNVCVHVFLSRAPAVFHSWRHHALGVDGNAVRRCFRSACQRRNGCAYVATGAVVCIVPPCVDAHVSTHFNAALKSAAPSSAPSPSAAILEDAVAPRQALFSPMQLGFIVGGGVVTMAALGAVSILFYRRSREHKSPEPAYARLACLSFGASGVA